MKTSKCKSRHRRFTNGELNHVYQRTISGFNIFYDIEDYLVYYTIFAVLVRCYEITAIGLCLMIDHIHMLIEAPDKKTLSKFMDHCTSVFVREYNFNIGREGGLFRKRFGSAPKIGLKIVRTSIAYLFNNPVEKGLCKKAEDYRWNFLAYNLNTSPFSNPPIIKKMTKPLQKAIREVRDTVVQNKHLKYGQIRRLFSRIKDSEYDILTDYIITTYNPIDYDKLISHYDSYESMLIAINSNTGSEYEIHEEYNPHSDMEYERMKDIITKMNINPIRKITQYSAEDKWDLFNLLKTQTHADSRQICKFLHMGTTQRTT